MLLLWGLAWPSQRLQGASKLCMTPGVRAEAAKMREHKLPQCCEMTASPCTSLVLYRQQNIYHWCMSIILFGASE